MNKFNEYELPVGEWDGVTDNVYYKGFFKNELDELGDPACVFTGYRRYIDSTAFKDGTYEKDGFLWGYNQLTYSRITTIELIFF